MVLSICACSNLRLVATKYLDVDLHSVYLLPSFKIQKPSGDPYGHQTGTFKHCHMKLLSCSHPVSPCIFRAHHKITYNSTTYSLIKTGLQSLQTSVCAHHFWCRLCAGAGPHTSSAVPQGLFICSFICFMPIYKGARGCSTPQKPQQGPWSARCALYI